MKEDDDVVSSSEDWKTKMCVPVKTVLTEH